MKWQYPEVTLFYVTFRSVGSKVRLMSILHPRILCVEDDKDSCEMLTMLLRLAGPHYRVISTGTAEHALERTGGESFDLYILDAILPDMSGFDLCREIRMLEPQSRIIFYTAAASENDRNKAEDAGADAFLVKPNDIDMLAETVARLLNQAARNSQTEQVGTVS